jgi:aromatic-L-amino-acid decarboxylase
MTMPHDGECPPPAGADALGLSTTEMRDLGYWVVDRVVEHFERGPSGPAIRVGSAAELHAALGGPVPQEPGDPYEAMERLVGVALEHMQHGDHPRYFARVPGPSSFGAVLGDWLGTGFNAIASSWGGGSGPATVELVVLEWLSSLLGMPEATEGVLLSGGSLANLTALAVARVAVGSGVAYLSDQAHSSIRRALQTLAFPAEHIRVLPSDAGLRLCAETVSAAVGSDRSRGLHPAIVITSAGTTNTGAVDELDQIAELCRSEQLWFHVDGAYGASAMLCDAGRRVLSGAERADSLVLDPHKWLFQPYDVGCLFVARPGVLERAFSMTPEYLADAYERRGEVDFGMRSPELSRRSRALKLWLTFRIYGAAALSSAIARGITSAEHAERAIGEGGFWEVVTPAQLGIVTFTRAGASEDDLSCCAAAVAADGFAAVTSTVLKDRPALRLCTINPKTTEADIEETLNRLALALPPS